MSHSSGRTPLGWAAGIIALMVIAAAVIAAFAPTGNPGSTAGDTTSSRPTTTASPGAAPEAGDGELDPPAAEDVIAGFLTAMASDDMSSVEAVAQGAIVDELHNDQLELEANGWTRSGTAMVESTSVLDVRSDETPVTATVSACIDSSDVQILDDAGVPVSGPSTSPRATNIFTLTVVDAAWRVTARTFPDDPAC